MCRSRRRFLLRGKCVCVLALAVSALIPSITLSAHHGNAVYDSSKQINLKGTVTQFVWANPHCVLLFDVTGDDGNVEHWTAETENPASMTTMGWNKSSLKPGDPIEIRVITVKNGKPIGRIVYVVHANGEKLLGRIVDNSAKQDDSK